MAKPSNNFDEWYKADAMIGQGDGERQNRELGERAAMLEQAKEARQGAGLAANSRVLLVVALVVVIAIVVALVFLLR